VRQLDDTTPHPRTERRWAVPCSALLLDLDGTLVDSADAVLRGWRRWARTAGVPVDGLAGFVHGRSAADTITRLMPDVTTAQLRRHVRRVLHLQEIDPAPAAPVAGAAALLDGLDGVSWAVVTGCSARMAQVRLAAGGLPAPPVLVTDEDVHAGKPSPAGYLLALERLGISPSGAVAVEDAPAGIEAARSAGLCTVAVTTTHPAADLAAAEIVVDSLTRLRLTRSGGRTMLVAEAGVPA
jgi:sugar-phosphatase